MKQILQIAQPVNLGQTLAAACAVIADGCSPRSSTQCISEGLSSGYPRTAWLGFKLRSYAISHCDQEILALTVRKQKEMLLQFILLPSECFIIPTTRTAAYVYVYCTCILGAKFNFLFFVNAVSDHSTQRRSIVTKLS